jgi:succinate-semialdehyde dehydrogenase / glutarate-semialdehyde dehydrogenase
MEHIDSPGVCKAAARACGSALRCAHAAARRVGVRSLDEVIEKSNALPYGLAAYAFTRSARTADQLAARVEAGNLSNNHFVASIAETPFGGVKERGYGREGGTEGLACCTVVKNVSHLMM